MGSRAAFNFAVSVVILTYNVVFPVKGQSTVQGCETGDSSINIVADLQQLKVEIFGELSKQGQSIHELLNASIQQMKIEHASVMRRLDVVIQLLLYHDISIKNQTQNPWNLAIGGVPVQLAIDIDLAGGLVLLPTVNNWIILMHRFDESLNFYRAWTEYRNGFGDIRRGEFWLGNEVVHRLTNTMGTVYTLRIEVYTNESWFYADYSTFSLESENKKYALRVSGFSGNAGDSLTNTSVSSDYYHGGLSFSTWDNDNDGDLRGNCAQHYEGGWWFNRCFYSCLTCQYEDHFKWWSLRHLLSNGSVGRARMMIKSK